jgi:hypothetical protein
MNLKHEELKLESSLLGIDRLFIPGIYYRRIEASLLAL